MQLIYKVVCSQNADFLQECLGWQVCILGELSQALLRHSPGPIGKARLWNKIQSSQYSLLCFLHTSPYTTFFYFIISVISPTDDKSFATVVSGAQRSLQFSKGRSQRLLLPVF